MTDVLAERYEIGELIGRGGMADVHAAVDRRLQRDVAVKIARTNGHGFADIESRFEDEARVAASIQHPNVVAVYDTGVTDDHRPFMVMERLPGETLADRLRSGPLSEPAVRALADDVLGALATAHAAGIVHRDVKPANILLTQDGRAKIADFGIARESDDLLVDPTTTNALTGTPAYLAPERIDGRPATARSDIWAVGVVLYEALAGVKPFTGDTPLSTAVAVRDGEFTPLQELRPDVDPALASAITRAMATDPEARFPTAGAMASALATDTDATVIDRTMTLAPMAGAAAAPAWWRSVATRPVAIAAATLAAVLLFIGVGIAAGDSDDPAQAETTTTILTTTTTLPPTTTTVARAPAVVDIRVGEEGQVGGNGTEGRDGRAAERKREGDRRKGDD